MSDKFFEDMPIGEIFDAIPAPAFIVDEDVKLLHWNCTARKLGLHKGHVSVLKGGEALKCVHASEGPGGCGTTLACKNCVIRTLVNDSINSSRVYRELAVVEICRSNRVEEIYLLVTASPFLCRSRKCAFLLLEDVSAILSAVQPEGWARQITFNPVEGLLLAPREQEILWWLKKGKSSWDISIILKITERTVNFHIYNIIKKLDAQNRTHAVAIAMEKGLIPSNPKLDYRA
ncbi:MAG: helix-turn-helix transcriptional regulator [Nitrospirae bacterium]|nr:helix-turn-helix transcriptional regulator [Nitrospirota bacterium]